MHDCTPGNRSERRKRERHVELGATARLGGLSWPSGRRVAAGELWFGSDAEPFASMKPTQVKTNAMPREQPAVSLVRLIAPTPADVAVLQQPAEPALDLDGL